MKGRKSIHSRSSGALRLLKRWGLLTSGSRCASTGATGRKPRGAMEGIFKGQFLG